MIDIGKEERTTHNRGNDSEGGEGIEINFDRERDGLTGDRDYIREKYIQLRRTIHR